MSIEEKIAKLSTSSKWNFTLQYNIMGNPELIASRWIGGKGYGRRKEHISIQNFSTWEVAREECRSFNITTDKGPGKKIVNKNCAVERARAILKKAG